MDVNVIVTLLLNESREIEDALRRKILDLQINLISANERVAELERKLNPAEPADIEIE